MNGKEPSTVTRDAEGLIVCTSSLSYRPQGQTNFSEGQEVLVGGNTHLAGRDFAVIIPAERKAHPRETWKA